MVWIIVFHLTRVLGGVGVNHVDAPLTAQVADESCFLLKLLLEMISKSLQSASTFFHPLMMRANTCQHIERERQVPPS